MVEAAPVINKGLEGVYFTESRICKVDGVNGRLWYRGYTIESLAKDSCFEEVSYLLLYGKLPTKAEFEDFKSALIRSMDLEADIVGMIKSFAGRAVPMDILRTVVSSLSVYENGVYQDEASANIQRSIGLIGKAAAIVATIGRFLAGGNYIKPDMGLGVAANIIRMLTGVGDDKKAKMLDTMMVLHAEHSSNASTFCTIVAGSTLADIYSAVTAGISALKGPLHGGADEKALEMMKAIGTPENTEKYIDEALEGKQRIMGFGHRVYKAYDPRAKIIKAYLEDIQNDSNPEVQTLTAIALQAEKMMIDKLGKSKGIWPNVDFFSGPVYTYIGIPKALFTPLFAASRMPGWCAHMLEYWQDNRLLRPLDYYTGQLDLPYVPLDQRK
ncbi:citrate/2-methylcitrate synthase [Candidatus Marsarchaeota archaeon]|nr:citrate/2-methylcitrate synthase [Candidatus Marsarchaeota archaeon]MCL5404903.1 citrate/2-methylcitrate synthase [Candidatus Marsarchaeota archaeon]